MLKPAAMPKPKTFRRNKWANKAKQIKLDLQRIDDRSPKSVALDTGRDRHVNMNVHVVKSGVYKNYPTFKERKQNGMPVVQEIDYEKEFEREATRNYELINIRTVKLKHGRHKGEKVDVDTVNNPPGVRYNVRAWK